MFEKLVYRSLLGTRDQTMAEHGCDLARVGRAPIFTILRELRDFCRRRNSSMTYGASNLRNTAGSGDSGDSGEADPDWFPQIFLTDHRDTCLPSAARAPARPPIIA